MVKTSPYQDGTDYTELGNVGSDAEEARDAALAAQAAAEAAQTAAESAVGNAEGSATAAASSASSASTSASSASTSATSASTSATNASTAASSASTSASTATTQATNAASSASAASTSATNASNSATSASTSASTATTQATNASNSATAAASSASAASTSETNAASSATSASGSATAATTQATNAAASATSASGSATTATTQASNASTSATAAAASQTAAATSATNAATSETNAAASATTAASLAAKITGTSTSSVTIGTGSKSFTTQASKDFNVGTHIHIADNADPAKWMFGNITAYNSGTGALDVNVLTTNGSGTLSAWDLYGRAGPRGAPAAGTGDFVGPASSVSGNIVTFGDATGKLGADAGITPTAAGITILEAADAAAQRTALALVVGTDVQPYDADLAAFAAKTAPSGDVVGTSDTQILTNKSIVATQLTGTVADARLSSNIPRLDTADQVLTGGVIVTSNSLGTITSGTVTPDPGDRPLQHYTNGGAHTLAPSSNKGTTVVEIVNNGSAGAITTSGFTKATGDAFTTTSGHKFLCAIFISNSYSLLQVQALQ